MSSDTPLHLDPHREENDHYWREAGKAVDDALAQLQKHLEARDREIARLRRLEPSPMMEVVRLMALALLASTGFVLLVTPGGFFFAIAVLVSTVVMWALTP